MTEPIESISKIIGADRVKIDADSIKHYGRDWTTYFDINAMAVLFPKTPEDVVQIVKWARKNKISLIPSGGRTGLSAAAVATKGEVIVSFETMNQVLDFNSIEQTVTVQPGVVTENLQKFATEKGLYFPVDFASRGSSHIGGNIATNAGGIKVIRYGLMRDWVASLKVVTGEGELLELNRSLIKNATGYDLRHLFIGSEGTLGFVVEATIRLAAQPPPLKLLLMAASGLDAVMQIFADFKLSTSLVAFEMFSEKAMKHVTGHTGLSRPFETVTEYYLLAEIESRNEADENQILEVFERCMEKGLVLDGVLAQSETQAKNFWRLREDITESLAKYTPYKNDISVSISKVPPFMRDLDEVLSKNYPTYEVVWFGHIGDGNLHISILRPEGMTKEEFVKECRKVDQLLFEVVRKYYGSISAEHGVGLTKKPFLEFTRSKSEIELMKKIKKVFDPDGIINPGKIFDL
jgi:glycolate oxidase subunit GlcD